MVNAQARLLGLLPLLLVRAQALTGDTIIGVHLTGYGQLRDLPVQVEREG